MNPRISSTSLEQLHKFIDNYVGHLIATSIVQDNTNEKVLNSFISGLGKTEEAEQTDLSYSLVLIEELYLHPERLKRYFVIGDDINFNDPEALQEICQYIKRHLENWQNKFKDFFNSYYDPAYFAILLAKGLPVIAPSDKVEDRDATKKDKELECTATFIQQSFAKSKDAFDKKQWFAAYRLYLDAFLQYEAQQEKSGSLSIINLLQLVDFFDKIAKCVADEVKSNPSSSYVNLAWEIRTEIKKILEDAKSKFSKALNDDKNSELANDIIDQQIKNYFGLIANAHNKETLEKSENYYGKIVQLIAMKENLPSDNYDISDATLAQYASKYNPTYESSLQSARDDLKR